MVSLKNVTVTISDTPILRNINLTIRKGKFIYIVGQSGAGKTSLLKTMYMDLIPNSGTVRIGQYSSAKMKRKKIPYLRRRLGIVFQDFRLLHDRTVFENVMFALRVTGTKTKEAQARSIKALTMVGLLSKKENRTGDLSGGELQRTCIARAIVNRPAIVLADEPTGNLDPDTGRDIIALFKKINDAGTAVVIATHNYSLIEEFPGRVLQLEDGKLSEKPAE